VVIAAWTAVGCAKNDPPPQAPSTPPSTTGLRVTGTEKIVWEQVANDQNQLARYHYIAYVDDMPVDLGVAKCVASATRSFSCSVALPQLQPGPHRLQLAVEEIGGQRRRSPKSGLVLIDMVPPKANP